MLGAQRARSGEHLEAEARLQASVAICREQHDLYRQGLALCELGQLYEPVGKTGKAEQMGAQAIAAYTGAAEIFEQLGAAYDLRIAQASLERVRARGMTFMCLNQSPEVERAMIRLKYTLSVTKRVE